MTPFDWTRRRLHSAAAFLLVILAAEFLKWQNPATAFGEVLFFLAAGLQKNFAAQASRTISR
ncbi:MAG TPA: hypothetical protein VHF01_05940 [Candidatus Acidoferrum sp.]|nr:hypothetical protein [Candidatus Acidoferrum sp.]